MIRIFQIGVFLLASLVLTGCNASGAGEPVWEDIKIGDLAPSVRGSQPAVRTFKTMDFGVYVFEIPAENISVLNDIWGRLDRSRAEKLLKFNDSKAFNANLFSIGFGQVQMWDEVADLLRAAGGRRVETASLLLPEGEAEDFLITRLPDKRSIWYYSSSGLVEGATIGPGVLALRIKAETIAGSRGVCRVEVQPLMPSMILTAVSRLKPQKESGDLVFDGVGFNLKMSPGEFFLLGPEKYVSDEVSLAGLFFNKAGQEPVVRTILFVCIRVSD